MTLWSLFEVKITRIAKEIGEVRMLGNRNLGRGFRFMPPGHMVHRLGLMKTTG